MLQKINIILRKICIPLNILNVLVGLLFGIAHVYLPLTSIFGLILGIIMAVSGSASIAISYYFTTKNTKHIANNHKEKPKLKNTTASNVFLGFAIPMILLSAAGSFFGMYTGVILLAAALAIPFAQPVVITIALVLACILASGTLINSWLQTHNIWESLKKPEEKTEKKSELEEQKTIEPKKTLHKPREEHTHDWAFSREIKQCERCSRFSGVMFNAAPEKRKRSSSMPPALRRSNP